MNGLEVELILPGEYSDPQDIDILEVESLIINQEVLESLEIIGELRKTSKNLWRIEMADHMELSKVMGVSRFFSSIFR